MPDKIDRDYLLHEQYKRANNLNARTQLHRLFSTNPYGWHRWVFDRLQLPPKAEILELGCGSGMLWRENLNRVPPGWRVTLSDFSVGMVDKARENLAAGRPFRFEVIDAQAIPLDNDAFDIAIANHMLYHVPDIPQALSEIRRVLRPGGRFMAATVGMEHMSELRALLEGFEPGLRPWVGVSPESFLLENGEAQIAAFFHDVSLAAYEDGLVVTDAEPLIAYVLSTKASAALVGDKRAGFERYVRDLLAERPFLITKATGMFEASA